MAAVVAATELKVSKLGGTGETSAPEEGGNYPLETKGVKRMEEGTVG